MVADLLSPNRCHKSIAKVKNYNFNETEVRDSDFKNDFPGIFPEFFVSDSKFVTICGCRYDRNRHHQVKVVTNTYRLYIRYQHRFNHFLDAGSAGTLQFSDF